MLRVVRRLSPVYRNARFQFDNDFSYDPKPVSDELNFEQYLNMLESINQRNVDTYTQLARPITELNSSRSKTDYRLIGKRFGKVVKLNRDDSLPAHGFISNQSSSPVLFFEDESPDVSMDFGYFQYDLIKDSNQYRAISLQRLTFS